MGCLTVIAALLGVFFWLWILETIDGTVWLALGVMAAFIFIVVMMLGTVGSASSHAQRQKQKRRLVNANRIYASQCKLVKMDDDGWLIEKFIGMDEPIMEIPKEFDGIPVHGIGAWAISWRRRYDIQTSKKIYSDMYCVGAYGHCIGVWRYPRTQHILNE